MPYLPKVFSVVEKHFQLPKQLSFAVMEVGKSQRQGLILATATVLLLSEFHMRTPHKKLYKPKVGEWMFFLRL